MKDNFLIRSELFKFHQVIGNPLNEVARFNEWSVDELIYLNISEGIQHKHYRADHKFCGIANNSLSILEAVSNYSFMPLTWGGKIRGLDDMHECFTSGADKVSINTIAIENKNIITKASRRFGRQAIVVSIDVFRDKCGKTEVCYNHGKSYTGMDPVLWAKEVEMLGAGEILLQSIDRDGTGMGYDVELIRDVCSSVNIPVIVCGGVGHYVHFVEGIRNGASAVAAANIWHYKELPYENVKKILHKNNILVRT